MKIRATGWILRAKPITFAPLALVATVSVFGLAAYQRIAEKVS